MSQQDIGNLRIEEKKVETNFSLVDGKIFITYNLMVKDLETGNFVRAGRSVQATNLTKEEFKKNIENQMNLIITHQQCEIEKINAL